MIVKKGFKYRIDVKPSQVELINKTIGCCRFVWNYFLEIQKTKFENKEKLLTYNQMSSMLTELKKEKTFLNEVDSISLQQELKDLSTAIKRYFEEQRKGNKEFGFPKFKSKKNTVQSYRTVLFRRSNGTQNINIKGRYIQLPKLGWAKFYKSREVEGKILNVTVSKTCSGKFNISICTEVEILPKKSNNNIIGIDLGIKDFLIDSEGNKINNPKTLQKYEQKLIKLQRKLSRQKLGSNNWRKTKLKLAKLHERIANIRLDFLHKLSTEIINENQVIISENLQVKNMIKNHKLAKSISDCSWSEFCRQLEYKAQWYSRTYYQIDTFFPSSKTCSECNYIKEDLELSDREWICPECGVIHDRDINAARNIKIQGMKELGLIA